VLEWLDATALSTWLKESPSVWAFPTVLTLHTTGMGILVGASYVLDLRLLGIGRNVPLSGYRWVFPTLAVGLSVNIFTGILLFIKDPTHWGTAFPFFVKMALVIASAATVVPMRSLVLGTGGQTGEVSSNMRLLAIASIVAWSGAITAGRLLAYVVP
jgi:hypothetical protein